MSKSESRAVRKMIGSAADSARSSRHSAKPPSTSAPRPMSMSARSGSRRAHRRQRFGAAGVGRDLVAVLAQRVGVVGADGGIVLDDGDAARHGGDYSRTRGRAKPAARGLPELFAALPDSSALCQRPAPAAAGRLFNDAHGKRTETKTTGPAAARAARPRLALGVAVAVALAGVAMLLAAPAYAGEGSLLLERRGAMAEAARLSAEIESREDGEAVMTRIVEVVPQPVCRTLAGVYLYRLPANAVLERLSFTPEAGRGRPCAADPGGKPRRWSSPPKRLGPGETLMVELVYRTRSVRRVLALRSASCCSPS